MSRIDALEARKKSFTQLNVWLAEVGGAWLTSVIGDPRMCLEVLPGSAIPDELRDRGYSVIHDGQRTRILADAITETLTTNRDGSASYLTAGSTQAVTRRVHHAGLCTVDRFIVTAPPSPPPFVAAKVPSVKTYMERRAGLREKRRVKSP